MIDTEIIHVTKRLRQIAHAINKHSKYLQDAYRLTLPQIVCLREIYAHGPISLSKLTRVVSLNNSTVTGIVDRLEREGLVRRERTSTDRRQIHIQITESGVASLKKAPPPLNKQFVEAFERLDDARKQELIDALDQLAELLFPSSRITGVHDVPEVTVEEIPEDLKGLSPSEEIGTPPAEHEAGHEAPQTTHSARPDP